MSGNVRKLNANPPKIAIATNEGRLLRVESDWTHKCILSNHMANSRLLETSDPNEIHIEPTKIVKPANSRGSARSPPRMKSGIQTSFKGEAAAAADGVGGALEGIDHAITLSDDVTALGGTKGIVTVKTPSNPPQFLRYAKDSSQSNGGISSDLDLIKVTQPPLGFKSALKAIDNFHNSAQEAAVMNNKIAPKFVRMTDIPLDTSEEQLNNLKVNGLNKLKKLRRYKYGISPTHKNIRFEEYAQENNLMYSPNANANNYNIQTESTNNDTFGDSKNTFNDADFEVVDVRTSPDVFSNARPLSSSEAASVSSGSRPRTAESPISRTSSARQGGSIRMRGSTGQLPDTEEPVLAPHIYSREGSRPALSSALAPVLPDKDMTIQAMNPRLVNYQLIENAPNSAQNANAGSKRGQKLYDAKEFRRPIPHSEEELLEMKIKDEEMKIREQEERSLHSEKGSKASNPSQSRQPKNVMSKAAGRGHDEASTHSLFSSDSAADNYNSQELTKKITCNQCSNIGTLWCGECALAFCYVCWGQVSHHSQLDVGDFFAPGVKSSDLNSVGNNYSFHNHPNKSQVVEKLGLGSDCKSFHSYNETRGDVDLSSLPFRLPKKPYQKHKDYHLDPIVMDGKGAISELKNSYLRPMHRPHSSDIKSDANEYESDSNNKVLDDDVTGSDDPVSQLNVPPFSDGLSDLDMLSRINGVNTRGRLSKKHPLFIRSASTGAVKDLVPAASTSYRGMTAIAEELDKVVGFSHSAKAKELEDKQIEFSKTNRVGLPGEARKLKIERKRRRMYKKIEKKVQNRGAIISIGPNGSASCVPPRVIGSDAQFIKVSDKNLIDIFPPGKEADRKMGYHKGKVVFTVDVHKEPEIPYVPFKDRITTGTFSESVIDESAPDAAGGIDNIAPGNVQQSIKPVTPNPSGSEVNIPTNKMSLVRDIATTRAFMEELTDTQLDAPALKASLGLTVQVSDFGK